MDFEAIKTGFFNYLEQKNEELGKKEPVINSDISIFMHSDEFKDYLIDEVGANSDIFSKSINDILSMEIVNGQLQEVQDNSQETEDSAAQSEEADTSDDTYNTDMFITDALNSLFKNEEIASYLDTDSNKELSEGEINTFLSGIANSEDGVISFDSIANIVQSINEGTFKMPESNKSEVDKLLGSMYENDYITQQLDLDGDKALSDEEKAKFEDFIKGFDGNIEDLSKEDVLKALDSLANDNFSYDKSIEEILKENEEDEKAIQKAVEEAQEASPAAASGGAAPSGGSAPSGESFTPSTTGSNLNDFQNVEKTIDNMTLDELESEKATREENLQEAQENVNKVHSGENEAVKNAQEDCDQAKEDYDKAVENDENISDELKERRDTNLEAIDKQESLINDYEIKINDKEAEISSKEDNISSIKSNINALESTENSLPSESEYADDPEMQAEIKAKRESIEQQITEAKNQLKTEEQDLTKLNNELDELNKNLETEKTTLQELKDEKAEIEEEILANCSPETKEALEKYNEAKKNLEDVKASELETAEKAVETAQKDLDEVNTKINEKKAEKTERENGINTAGKDFLEELSKLGGEAPKYLGNLCNALDMTAEEVGEYLTELCESPDFGNGCITPTLLFAQMYQESGFNPTIVGDGGAALGLGQFHKVAVDEVNNRYKTNYTYEDRANPKKAIEMMTLLLRYDYKCTGSTEGMLAMYNQGHPDAINEPKGQAYVRHVYEKIGM